MARGLRQPANEPELEFVPEEQELEFVPEAQDGNLTKAQYIASGGRPEDVISPEREAVLQAETQRQLQAGATPEQAAVAAGQAVDQMGTIRRPDGTIAEGFKPTEQALREGIIEQPAIPAVKEAQRLGIETVSSGTDKDTGGGFAIGKTKEGKLVRVESSPQGEVDVFEIEEEPSRLGAVARTVAREIIPATVAGAAARVGAMVPAPAPVRIGAGLLAGLGGYVAAERAQKAGIEATIGQARAAELEEQRKRDIEAFPVSTTAAAILTPTIGGAAGVLRGIGRAGVEGFRGAVAKEVAEAAPKAAEEIGGAVKIPEPPAGMGIRRTPERIIEDVTLSKEMREKLAKSPEIQYETFGVKRAAEEIANLADDKIEEIARLGSQPERVVATAVKFNKAVERGDIAAQEAVAKELGLLATSPAQALNAFKVLKTSTPQGYLLGLTQMLSKAERRLTPELSQQAQTLFARKQVAQSNFDRLAARARETLDDVDIEKAIRAERVLTDRLYRLQTFESRLVPKKFFGEILPTIIQGNLLTPMSLATNIWANAINAPIRMMARQVAFAGQEMGRAFQAMRGKELGERLIAPPTGGIRRTIEAAKGAGRGFVEGLRGLRYGISPEGLLAGEKIRGFQPGIAFKQFWNKQGLAESTKQGLSRLRGDIADRARLAAEATLGVPAETMLRLLQLGDTPFRRLTQARLLAEQAQLQIPRITSRISELSQKAKLTKQERIELNNLRKQSETIKREPRKFIGTLSRLPGEREISKIEEEASQAVFQQDSMLARAALNAANLFGAGDKSGLARFIGKTIIPYAKTPANVIDELVEFAVPPYSMWKAVSASNAGNKREAMIQLGKAATGSALMLTAYELSRLGIIGGKAEKGEKARDIQYQALPPKTINISALNRWAGGGSPELEPGDRVINLEKLGIVGGILSTIQAARDATESGDQTLELAAILPETISFAFNQSFLKGTNSLLSAMSSGESTQLDTWLSNYYGTIASIPLPNTLAAVSRAMNESMPDKIRAQDIPGTIPGERTINMFGEILKRRVPGLQEDLPVRVDVWGREVPQTPEGADPIAYNFFDVTKGREVTYDPITLATYRLYRETGDGDVIPPKPLRDFTIGKNTYRLTPELYEEYAKIRGKASRQFAEQMFKNKNFRKMDSDEKVTVLRRGYNEAIALAREQFLSRYESRIKLNPKP